MHFDYSSKNYPCVLILLGLGVTACASQSDQQDAGVKLLHICDDTGCHDRPSNYSSLTTAPAEIEDPQIVSLKELAANDSRAAYDLALRYYRGDGVRVNHYQSIQWMRKAAENGYLEAQKALGRLYLTGLGETGPDYAEAQKWLSLSASRGDKEGGKLLEEANGARAAEVDDYQWRRNWQITFQNNWFSGYRYNWSWRPNYGWHLY